MSKIRLNDKQELPYGRVETYFVMCVGSFPQKCW